MSFYTLKLGDNNIFGLSDGSVVLGTLMNNATKEYKFKFYPLNEIAADNFIKDDTVIIDAATKQVIHNHERFDIPAWFSANLPPYFIKSLTYAIIFTDLSIFKATLIKEQNVSGTNILQLKLEGINEKAKRLISKIYKNDPDLDHIIVMKNRRNGPFSIHEPPNNSKLFPTEILYIVILPEFKVQDNIQLKHVKVPDSDNSEESYNGDIDLPAKSSVDLEINRLITASKKMTISLVINDRAEMPTINLHNQTLTTIDTSGNDCVIVKFGSYEVDIESFYYGMEYGHTCMPIQNDEFFAIIFMLARIRHTPIINLTDASIKNFKVASIKNKLGHEIVELDNIPLSMKSHISFYRRNGFHNKIREKAIVKFARTPLFTKKDPEKTYGLLARNVVARLVNDSDTPLTDNDWRRINILNYLTVPGGDKYHANAKIDNNGLIATLKKVTASNGKIQIHVTITQTKPSDVVMKRHARTKRTEELYLTEYDLKGNPLGGTRKRQGSNIGIL